MQLHQQPQPQPAQAATPSPSSFFSLATSPPLQETAVAFQLEKPGDMVEEEVELVVEGEGKGKGHG